MQLQDPAISQAIKRHMATGNYRSADEVVLRALRALDDIPRQCQTWLIASRMKKLDEYDL